MCLYLPVCQITHSTHNAHAYYDEHHDQSRDNQACITWLLNCKTIVMDESAIVCSALPQVCAVVNGNLRSPSAVKPIYIFDGQFHCDNYSQHIWTFDAALKLIVVD